MPGKASGITGARWKRFRFASKQTPCQLSVSETAWAGPCHETTYFLQERASDDFAWQETIGGHQNPSMLVEDGGRESDPLRPIRVSLAHPSRVDGEASHNQASGERLHP